MKTVVVGFSRPREFFKPFSWLIRLVERTPYSHVYLRTRSSTYCVDIVYQASSTQVNFVGYERFLSHCIVIKEFMFEIDDQSYSDYMKWAICNSGSSYSLKQILGMSLVKMFNLKKNPLGNGSTSWVCSELVGFVLKRFKGAELTDSDIETAGPKKIFEICEKLSKL